MPLHACLLEHGAWDGSMLVYVVSFLTSFPGPSGPSSSVDSSERPYLK